MASVQTTTEQVFGPTGVAVYASLATLALEQQRVTTGTIVATQSPFAFFQAVETPNGPYSAVSTSSTAYGPAIVTYWVPVGGNVSGNAPNTAAAVVTALPGGYTGSGTGTLTASANGAITSGDTDGVTVAVGQTVFLQAGLTHLTSAVDSGPFVVVSLGSASSKYVLTRPTWFLTGTVPAPSTVVTILGGGAVFGFTKWRATTNPPLAIDANDPGFYVETISFAATLVSGTKALTGATLPFGVYSSLSSIQLQLFGSATTATSTSSYGGVINTLGYDGTSEITINAYQTGMTVATLDGSKLVVTVTNTPL